MQSALYTDDNTLIAKFLDHLEVEKRYSTHTLSGYSRELNKFAAYLQDVGLGAQGELDDRDKTPLLCVRPHDVTAGNRG